MGVLPAGLCVGVGGVGASPEPGCPCWPVAGVTSQSLCFLGTFPWVVGLGLVAEALVGWGGGHSLPPPAL